MAARRLLAALTCGTLACSNAAPAARELPAPVTIPTAAPGPEAAAPGPEAAAPEPEPEGDAPDPEAEIAPPDAPEPEPEPALDPATVAVPPLDADAVAAIDAFLALQRSIAAETVPRADNAYMSLRAREILHKLKWASQNAARRVIWAGLAAGERGPEALAIQVKKALSLAGAAVERFSVPAPTQEIGAIADVEVTRPDGHPGKLGVVVTLSVPCGSDASLTVLEEQPGRPPVVRMALEDSGYPSVSGGHMELAYRLSPPDERGRWFAVVATAAPSCSSAWRGIDYRVLVPGTSADAPSRAFHMSDRAFFTNPPAEIEAGADDFQVRFLGSGAFSDELVRPDVRRYARRGGAFARVQPIAEDPIDAPRAWAAMPWSVARRFVKGSSPDALRPWHRKLGYAAIAEPEAVLAVESRDEAAGRVRLALTCPKGRSLPEKLWIDVSRDGPGWAMEAVTPGP